MAKIQLTYTEDDADGLPYGQEVTITRDDVEDMYDVLAFLSDAVRASGYGFVDRMAYATNKGETVWSKF